MCDLLDHYWLQHGSVAQPGAARPAQPRVRCNTGCENTSITGPGSAPDSLALIVLSLLAARSCRCLSLTPWPRPGRLKVRLCSFASLEPRPRLASLWVRLLVLLACNTNYYDHSKVNIFITEANIFS